VPWFSTHTLQKPLRKNSSRGVSRSLCVRPEINKSLSHPQPEQGFIPAIQHHIPRRTRRSPATSSRLLRRYKGKTWTVTKPAERWPRPLAVALCNERARRELNLIYRTVQICTKHIRRSGAQLCVDLQFRIKNKRFSIVINYVIFGS
jgi:hypothetical protein